MLTLAQVTAFSDALSAATAASQGTADIYAIPSPAKRIALIKFQRDYIRKNANGTIPGWAGSDIEPAAMPLVGWIRTRSMLDWDFTVSFLNGVFDALPSNPSAPPIFNPTTGDVRGYMYNRAAYFMPGLGKELTEAQRLQKFVTPAAQNQAVVFAIRTRAQYDATAAAQKALGILYSPAERIAWMTPDAAVSADLAASNAAGMQSALSFLNQNIDPKVTLPAVYGLDRSAIENAHRNLANANLYFAAVNAQMELVAAGKPLVQVTPAYAQPYEDENFWVKYSKQIIGVFEIVLLFYVAAPLIKNIMINATGVGGAGGVTGAIGTAIKPIVGAVTAVVGGGGAGSATGTSLYDATKAKIEAAVASAIVGGGKGSPNLTIPPGETGTGSPDGIAPPGGSAPAKKSSAAPWLIGLTLAAALLGGS